MNRTSLAHQIAEKLENWIFQEAEGLRPGERIREVQLARKLCTSQAPVREALRLLEERGVVVHNPNRGTSVVILSEDEVNDIIRVRIPLEIYALECARLRATDSEKKELTILFEALGESADANDLLLYHELHTNFHKYVWKLSGNVQLLKTLERLCTPLWAFYRQRVRQKQKRSLSGRRSHQAIVEFVLATEKSKRTASDITKEHYHDVAGYSPNEITA